MLRKPESPAAASKRRDGLAAKALSSVATTRELSSLLAGKALAKQNASIHRPYPKRSRTAVEYPSSAPKPSGTSTGVFDRVLDRTAQRRCSFEAPVATPEYRRSVHSALA